MPSIQLQWLFCLQLTTMGSSEQLTKDFKMKMVHLEQEEEGHKNSQCFNLPISTVRNIIQKWLINGTVEVKASSERPRNISDRLARDQVKKCSTHEPTHHWKRAAKKSSRHRSS